MLPAFTVNAKFEQRIDDASTEVSDVCTALAALNLWTTDAEIECRPTFSDPKLRADPQALNDALVSENRLFSRVKRLLRGGSAPGRETLFRAIHNAEKMHVYLRDYNTDIEFASAAIRAMDCMVLKNFVAMGKSVCNRLDISLWPQCWQDYSCWLNPVHSRCSSFPIVGCHRSWPKAALRLTQFSVT
jgi:hypothetical protein